MLEIIGAQSGHDHAVDGVQDPILVEAGNPVQAPQEGPPDRLRLVIALPGAGGDHLGNVLLQHGITAALPGAQAFEIARQMLLGQFPAVLARRVPPGIEQRVEQFDQQAGQQRVPRQRFRHVGQRERRPGLQQVLAVGAQHLHLAPAQLAGQDQPVQAVAGGRAALDVAESLLEIVPHPVQVQVAGRGVDHVEILDPDRLLVREVQFVGPLADDVQAHVLQHRQHRGKRYRLVVAEQLEADDARTALARPVQAHAEVSGTRQRGDLLHVETGHPRRDILAVRGREGAADGCGPLQPRVLAEALHQCVAQFVGPTPHGLDDLLLQGTGVRLRVGAGLRAHDDLQTGQRRLGNLHHVIQRLGLQGPPEDFLDPLPVLRVVLVAGDVYQAGEEPAEPLPADQQPDAPALLQVEHLRGHVGEVFDGGLEQLVAGQRLQDVNQRLARVAALAQAGLLQHGTDLHPDQRGIQGPAEIGFRCEESDEAAFAHRAATLVETQHADVVHVAHAVHGAARSRLGNDQRVVPVGAGLLAQGRQRASADGFVRLAQDAAAGALDHVQGCLPLAAHDPVIARTEKDEVVLAHPGQEFTALVLDFRVRHRGPLWQSFGRLAGHGGHVLPVLDRHAHVGHGRDQAGLDAGQHLRVVLAIHLHVDDGLGLALPLGGRVD